MTAIARQRGVENTFLASRSIRPVEEWWDETAAAEMTFDWQTSAVPTTASVPQTLAVPTTAPQTLVAVNSKPGADAVSGPGAAHAPTALAADSLGPEQQQGPGEAWGGYRKSLVLLTSININGIMLGHVS